MKIEFLHQWRRSHAASTRDRIIANLPRWAPWAARLPWLANLRDVIPGMPWVGERMLGFSGRRSLPRWRRDTFLRKYPASTVDRATAQREGAQVVLLADTFNNYFEPENLNAALAVLQAAGYAVVVARANPDAEPQRPLCCGRTWLGAGFVERAKHEARRTLASLLPHVDNGATVVGLEPSCLLSMRDEYLVMGLGDGAKRVAARAMTFEEFLSSEHRAGRLRLPLRGLPQTRALVHGHCHQKAFGAMTAVRETLALIPGLAVDVIESSCCGMAGGFGYEAEHYDVSMRMAELSLLPAVRAAAADTIVVADGTSCRHQIGDGTRHDAGSLEHGHTR